MGLKKRGKAIGGGTARGFKTLKEARAFHDAQIAKYKTTKKLASSVPAPPSVAELARALQYNVDTIFEWVYNNVDFVPTWITQKGAFGTLIDQAANSFDQTTLLLALLYPHYETSYVVGSVRFTPAQLQNLLGTTTDGASVSILTASNVPFTATYGDDGLLYVDMQDEDGHPAYCWAQVTIGETTYQFDPSFKAYTYTEGSADIGAITGFSLTDVQSDASDGATINDDYIQNLNSANICSDYKTYATNLLNWINTNEFDASMETLIGGRTIQPLGPTPVRNTTLPNITPGTTPTVYPYPPVADDEFSSVYRSFIVFDGLDRGLCKRWLRCSACESKK
jgi:hypothetical protein